jgi:DNA repair ATPase RecN
LRVDEIARMLAGEKITPEARSAARVLMESTA